MRSRFSAAADISFRHESADGPLFDERGSRKHPTRRLVQSVILSCVLLYQPPLISPHFHMPGFRFERKRVDIASHD